MVGLPAGSGHAVAGAQSAKVTSKPAQSTGRQAIGFEEAGLPVVHDALRAATLQERYDRQAHTLKQGASGLVAVSAFRPTRLARRSKGRKASAANPPPAGSQDWFLCRHSTTARTKSPAEAGLSLEFS